MIALHEWESVERFYLMRGREIVGNGDVFRYLMKSKGSRIYQGQEAVDCIKSVRWSGRLAA